MKAADQNVLLIQTVLRTEHVLQINVKIPVQECVDRTPNVKWLITSLNVVACTTISVILTKTAYSEKVNNYFILNFLQQSEILLKLDVPYLHTIVTQTIHIINEWWAFTRILHKVIISPKNLICGIIL